MSDFAVDTDGDLALTNGDATLSTGLEAIRQHLQIRLTTFLGEWFLDTTVGVPYIQVVFANKNPDVLSIQSVLRREVLKTPGVLSIINLTAELDRTNRSFLINLDVRTVEGDASLTLQAGV